MRPMPIRPKGWPRSLNKDVGPFPPFSLLLPLKEFEAVHLIPLEVMDAISAALEPADDEGALPQVDVIPAQIAGLRDPIPVTLPVAHEGGEQLVHFGLGQVLPDPVGIVPLASIRPTGRITILFGLPKPYDFA
jgi:hypothetical protein